MDKLYLTAGAGVVLMVVASPVIISIAGILAAVWPILPLVLIGGAVAASRPSTPGKKPEGKDKAV